MDDELSHCEAIANAACEYIRADRRFNSLALFGLDKRSRGYGDALAAAWSAVVQAKAKINAAVGEWSNNDNA